MFFIGYCSNWLIKFLIYSPETWLLDCFPLHTVILCALQLPGLHVSARSVSAGVRSRVHCESSAPDNLNVNADRCRYSVRHLPLGRLSRQASIFSSAMPCSEGRSVTLPCRPHLTGSASNQLCHHNKRKPLTILFTPCRMESKLEGEWSYL